MEFIADLHIHSRFSRATAKNLDFENLYVAAQQKGITVLGTGDFTHPGWFSEINEKLVPAEAGLFKLREEIARQCDKNIPPTCRGPVRFMLVSEISNIYKKNDRTRKNHNLVFMPDLDTAARFNSSLDKIGNIKSDGRPILGLDARHLLDIVLDTSSLAFLIPAHIWTPWFSLLGSKSGFDTIEECFEDLTPHIFAVETGLSSDPAMNWRVSMLDGLTLVSNSDAHSPSKLGREANIFDTELDYTAIKLAMETGDPLRFKGTYEFYPEEGKYHLDGHRKCGVRLTPVESIKNSGKCPVCGKGLTLGVLYRVEELADRPHNETPDNHHPYETLIPLKEVLSELLKVGPNSKKVQHHYTTALETLGPEIDILQRRSLEELDRAGIPLLGAAINKIRQNKINLFPGFDGEFGKIQIFSDQERQALEGQRSLFLSPDKGPQVFDKNIWARGGTQNFRPPENRSTPEQPMDEKKVVHLNRWQEKAVQHEGAPLLIVAGPGTGKTLTLTHKIAHLIKERDVDPGRILAVTFTNKAAQEMKERLERLLGPGNHMPYAATFHALCFRLLHALGTHTGGTIVVDEVEQAAIIEAIAGQVKKKTGAAIPAKKNLINAIVLAKQQILTPSDNLETVAAQSGCEAALLRQVYQAYQNQLSLQNACDFEDLIFKVAKLFESDEKFLLTHQERFKYIFVDEYQDLNLGQYRIVKALAPADKEICVIGDPDQSIYGFRGSDVRYFNQFIDDYPEAEVINLTRNYRSTETILEASHQVISDQHITVSGSRVYSGIDGKKTITVLEQVSDKAEAVAVGKIIESMIGGVGLHSIDFDKVDDQDAEEDRGFSDFAVLYRTGAQATVFKEVFEKAGIPCQVVSRENHYSKKGIQELLSFLKIVCRQGTYTDLERVIKIWKKGVGKKTFGVLKEWCFENKISLNEIVFNTEEQAVKGLSQAQLQNLKGVFGDLSALEKEMKLMPFDQMLMFLKDKVRELNSAIKSGSKTEEIFSGLLRMSSDYKENPAGFFEKIFLQEETDAYEFKDEKVALMTMHAAKGLEFPIVFIVGCENGFIPHSRSSAGMADIDEENRLFYVAMTRAREHLYLTYAKKRIIYGKSEEREISPFVRNIEEGLRSHEVSRARSKKKEKHVQLDLF